MQRVTVVHQPVGASSEEGMELDSLASIIDGARSSAAIQRVRARLFSRHLSMSYDRSTRTYLTMG